MTRAAARPSAVERRIIDRTPDPALTARFAADLRPLWPEGQGGDVRLGLAVSGGPDSLALLLLAAAALPGRVEAASVDHGLRAASSDETAMVAALCADLLIPHETLPVAVAPGNLQDRARGARYAALSDWCGRRGLAALATGHQLDDQAETLVMRLNRGSGLAGLAGVRARGSVAASKLPVLRPLLGWRRAELAAVVAGAGLAPAQDPSNEDERFDRVRIRHALAAAEWLDPIGLATSAARLGQAESYLAEQIATAWEARVSRDKETFVFTPGPSDYEALEIARRIVAAMGAAPVRSEVAALVARLRRGENASLGGVLVRVINARWVFACEPARRSADPNSQVHP
jgi:tRNA(Ile)-lysidine synthase